MCVCVCVCVCVRARSVTPDSLQPPWTVANQAPLSLEFSRREYWNGFLVPPPGNLPNPGIEPISLSSTALEGGFFSTSATWQVPI